MAAKRPMPCQQPTHAWEALQLGNCGPPIETEARWLVLSNQDDLGVRLAPPGGARVGRTGAGSGVTRATAAPSSQAPNRTPQCRLTIHRYRHSTAPRSPEPARAVAQPQAACRPAV